MQTIDNCKKLIPNLAAVNLVFCIQIVCDWYLIHFLLEGSSLVTKNCAEWIMLNVSTWSTWSTWWTKAQLLYWRKFWSDLLLKVIKNLRFPILWKTSIRQLLPSYNKWRCAKVLAPFSVFLFWNSEAVGASLALFRHSGIYDRCTPCSGFCDSLFVRH